MPRPTSKPRLATLDAAVLAKDVEARIDRYLGRLAAPLSPGVVLHAQRHGDSGISLTVAGLTEYAQRGLPASDWQTHGEARDAIQSALETLYGCPAGADGAGPIDDPGEQLDEADIDDPLALVLVAAWARVQLADGEGLTARQLAVLAGVDPDAVRSMANDGEVRLTGARPAKASAREAKRWLGSRGIKGL